MDARLGSRRKPYHGVRMRANHFPGKLHLVSDRLALSQMPTFKLARPFRP
jgi:hypothetical protein